MFNTVVHIGDVGHAIQLALAPAFLLTGIAGLLNVMAGRLARIIDRGRRLAELSRPPGAQLSDDQNQELNSLERRRYLASAAITACTLAALLVCMVIASLFLEVLLQLDLKWVIGLLFTGATLAMVTGLAYFLQEVHKATLSVRIPHPVKKPAE
jgi:MFS family permease